MKLKWLPMAIVGLLLFCTAPPAAAEGKSSLSDEIIYDVLVDRFFNKGIENDVQVDSRNPEAFSGGDFAGLNSEMQYIKDMGITLLSIGPVFSSTSYDGKEAEEFSSLEPRFGTEEEFKEVIKRAHELDLKIMVDIPTQNLSPYHIWRSENPDWFKENADGTVALDTSNLDVQEALIDAIEEFLTIYNIDGLRLQSSNELDSGFIERFSASMKNTRDVYIIGDSAMEPQKGLDAVVVPGIEENLRNRYKKFNPDVPETPIPWSEVEGNLIQVDSLNSARFTSDVVKENGFPPTRWNLLMFQLLTMPGIPVIQYGSEIAVNGIDQPYNHPILDLGVDDELIDHITNLTSLRNDSEALRTGDTEILHDEAGWMVYKRSNQEESWIIAINNSSSTKSFTLPADVVGANKELRGLFESNVVREGEEGGYKITLDRELGEAFNVIERQGFNKAYIGALITLYVSFLTFLWFAWRIGKKRRTQQKKEKRVLERG